MKAWFIFAEEQRTIWTYTLCSTICKPAILRVGQSFQCGNSLQRRNNLFRRSGRSWSTSDSSRFRLRLSRKTGDALRSDRETPFRKTANVLIKPEATARVSLSSFSSTAPACAIADRDILLRHANHLSLLRALPQTDTALNRIAICTQNNVRRKILHQLCVTSSQ